VINGSPVAIGAGSSSGNVNFHPVGPGSSLISVIEPTGFATPTSGRTLTATVSGPKVLLNPVTVGANLEVRGFAQLDTAAPSEGVTVTISSNSPSVLLSTDATVQGGSSIQLPVMGGSKVIPFFYVQGLASSGTAQLSASASGYTMGTGDVQLVPSAFVVAGPGGAAGDPFSTTTISADSTLVLSPWALDGANKPYLVQTVRGGFSVSVAVSSGTPGTGTVAGTATFLGGDSSNAVLGFHPLAQGTSVLSVMQPTGFFVPSSGGSITASVTAPAVTIGSQLSVVGANLQIQATGSLNTPAPSALTVHISSGNSSAVLLATSSTGLGASSIDLTIPAGGQSKEFPPFWVQGLQASGTVTLTATVSSESGWTPSLIQITLAPAGFVLHSPNGIGAAFATTAGQPSTALSVQSAQLDPVSHALVNLEQLRGGIAVSVTVTSQHPAVGTISGSPVSFQGGDSGETISFNPLSSGATVLSVSQPTGFTTPASGASLTANVN